MSNLGYIYGLEDPRTGEIRYVGKTVQRLSKRVESHCAPSKLAARTHKNSWLKSLRSENLRPETVVIQVLPEADLNVAEIYWISTLRDRGFDLTNGTDGGEGATTGKHQISAEGRRRIGEAQRKLRSRPVIETTSGRIFPSSREAERALNLYSNAVSRVLRGKQAQAAGYRFQLYTEN